MSLAITHSFVAHTDIQSSQVNQNFQDVSTWANNLFPIAISNTALGTYTAPTAVTVAVWTGSTGSPSIGNGTFLGSYCQIGKKVFFEYSIIWGSTTSTAGAGNWIFTLPGGMTAVRAVVVTGLAFDSSLNSGTQCVGRIDTSGTQVIRVYAGGVVGEGSPFAWTTSDLFYLTGFFEVA